MSFTVEGISTPNLPSGPTNAETNTSYSYVIGGSVSNVGHSIQYFFDWGDGTNSGWLPVGKTSASKSWTSPGTYSVKAKARCSIHNLIISSWSTALDVSMQKVAVLHPNGGEVIHSGSTSEIRWGTPPEATTFKLFYSLDNGATWKATNTGAPLTGSSYLWQVPKTEGNKPTCRIKVVGYNGTAKVGADISDKPFTIEVVKLTYPDGGEPPFSSEQDITITWTAYATIRPINQVKLLYTLDNGLTWKPFLSQPARGSDPGSHTVKLPKVTKVKSRCKVKADLKDATGKKVGSDVSDGVFTISP